MRQWLSQASMTHVLLTVFLLVTGLATAVIALISIRAINLLGVQSRAGQALLLESVGWWLLLLGVCALLWLVLNLAIVRPLTHLVLFSQRVRRGETTVRLAANGTNEVALVSASINAMLDVIVGQRDHLHAQICQLQEQVSTVGKGDLRTQATASDELGILADSFNYMVRELSTLIIRVKQVTQDVYITTANYQRQTTASVAIAEKQLHQIHTATTTVQRMARASRLVAAQAATLEQETRQASDLTVTGRERIAEIIRGMKTLHDLVQGTANQVLHLARRSQEIHQVVEVVATLAHQVNRLALDAAVQAAMAGEHGKGFEAVAYDIRRLAERTKEEVRKIESFVQGVKEEIQMVVASMNETKYEAIKGDRYVRETESVFTSIFTLAERQSAGMRAITEQASQQVEASHAIEHLMAEVAGATTIGTETLHLIEASISELTRKAHILEASVGAFHVPEHGVSTL